MSDMIPPGREPRSRPERRAAEPARFEFERRRPTGDARGDGDTIDLRQAVLILRRRAWLILLCMMGGAGLAYWLHDRQVPMYRAQAVIRVQDPTSQMSGQLTSADYGWSWTNPVQSTLEVLTGQSVLGAIVDRNGLRLVSLDPGFRVTQLDDLRVDENLPWDTVGIEFRSAGVEVFSQRTGLRVTAGYGDRVELEGIGFRVPRPPEEGPRTATLAVRDRQQAIRAVGAGITTAMRPQTNIVDVSYAAADPVLAQRVLNEAVVIFQERSANDARQSVMRRRAFLQDQMAQADTLLRISQQALSEFRIRGQVFSSQDQAMAQQSGLMSLEVRQEELRADREMYSALLSALRSATSEREVSERLQSLVAAPELAQNPVVASLFAQLMEYEIERESLTSGPFAASAQNPDVARLDQLVTTTRGRLEVAVQSHLDALEARSQALSDLRSRTAGQLAGLPEAEAQEARLIQEVQATQRTVEQLREELYRAQLAEAVEVGPVDVLELAPFPGASEQASLPVMLALGLMLGGLAGSGGAFLAEMLNTKLRAREDLERTLQVQVLGVIPKLPALAGGLRTGRKKLLRPAAGAGNGSAGSTSGALAGGNGASGEPEELITFRKTRSHQAEAFRTLRTNLIYARGDDVKTLVVTSALPAEGKTTTAANLAVTYAQQGFTVLLVDCDLRKPRIAQLFHLPRSPGLTELMMDGSPWLEAVHRIEAIDGLSVLTSGTLPPNPTELLGGARMRALLDVLRHRHDIVILDTPPLVGGADAAILGAACDGVLMVAKAGETQEQAARLAGQQLTTVGARLVGAVMNDPRGEMPKYGDHYYSYQYYGEG